MRHQVVNQLLHLWSVHVLFQPASAAAVGTDVNFLVRHEFGVGEDGAVFEVVDAE